MLHRLSELDEVVREGYDAFEFKRITRALIDFMQWSSCRPSISTSARTRSTATRRRACAARPALQVIRRSFDCLVTWLAPMLPFTTEEAWLRPRSRCRLGASRAVPGHSGGMEERGAGREMAQGPRRCAASSPARWRSSARTSASARRWRRRRSSMSPIPSFWRRSRDRISRRSASPPTSRIDGGEGPAEAFRLPEVAGVSVEPKLAEGRKCARSWRITTDVGSDPDYPDVSARDAAALRELARKKSNLS